MPDTKPKKLVIKIFLFIAGFILVIFSPYILYYINEFISKHINNENIIEIITPDKYMSLMVAITNFIVMASLSFCTYRISKQNGLLNNQTQEIRNAYYAKSILNEMKYLSIKCIKFYNNSSDQDLKIETHECMLERVIALHLCGYITDGEREFMETFFEETTNIVKAKQKEQKKKLVKQFLSKIYVNLTDVSSDYSKEFEKLKIKLNDISRKENKHAKTT